MRYFSDEELTRVLELHDMWVQSVGAEGECADMTGANLVAPKPTEED